MTAKILIIEDNLANLELMTYLFGAFGYNFAAATDGESGLDLARRQQPDLVICDIQLPGMDGYAVARALRDGSVRRGVPLIAVTAFAMVGDRDKILAAGFDGYISKPIDPEKFVQNVENFLPASLCSAGLPAAAATRAAVAAHPTGGRETILVVDDRAENVALKRSLFEPLGYAVVGASDMAGALEMARARHPDIIVSDLHMSDGNGFEFISAVKADPALKDIPFVFMTSTYCDEASKAHGLALGAARFLFRPMDAELILSEIETCLRDAKGGRHGSHSRG